MAEFRNTYAGNPLDRVAAQRRDEDWIRARLSDPATRLLPLHRLLAPLVEQDGESRLAWAPLSALERADPQSFPALLGVENGDENGDGAGARFAIDVSTTDDPLSALDLPQGTAFRDLREASGTLNAADAGIAAQARSLVDWHARHRHCAVCGAPTEPVQGGIFRKCIDCPAEHFPRTDPVVITVVHDGERCLLGRQASWPAGMFSALAGFIDHGESIEDAVRREVREEAGIEVRAIRYHSSQPWPFPASLMIGCLAEAETSNIDMDEFEMDDVQWFTRAEIQTALAAPPASIVGAPAPGGALSLPGPTAIAHTLITAWASE